MKLIKKMSISLLTLLMVTLSTITVNAEWDGNVSTGFSGGIGSESNPYLIKKESDLAYLNKMIDLDVDSSSLYFSLENNLDMTTSTWTCTTKAFDGHFNGNGHTIKINSTLFNNLSNTATIDYLNLVSTANMTVPILCSTNNGVVTNTSVYGSWSASSGYELALFIKNNYGSVINCWSDDISVNSQASYTAWIVNNYGNIENCYTYYDEYSVLNISGRYSSSKGEPICINYNSGKSKNSYSNKSGTYSTQKTGMTSQEFLDLLNENNPLEECRWYYDPSKPSACPVIKEIRLPSIYVNDIVNNNITYHTDTLAIKFTHPGNGYSIYYTVDGTDPTTSNTRMIYSSDSSFTIDGDVTVKSVVYYDGEYGSTVTQNCIKLLGKGTVDNPYLISTKIQLAAIRLDKQANYKLVNDLTFTATDADWDSISDFEGVFDGDGHAIYNIHGIDGGLFKSNSGTIKNIRLINHELFDEYATYNGAIVDTNNGIVTNCYVKSAFTKETIPTNHSGNFYVGGVVGHNLNTVERCRVDGVVGAIPVYKDGWIAVGGITGQGSARYCINEATIVSRSSAILSYKRIDYYAGAGDAYDCLNRGTIESNVPVNYNYYPGTYRTNNCINNSTSTEKSAYNLDFDDIWMITKNGAEPQGVMDKDGHSYYPVSYTSPTCVDTGLSILSDGKNGGSRVSQTLLALGHKAGKIEKENVVDATCIQDGYYDEVTYCGRCNEQISSEQKITEKLGHDLTKHDRLEPTYTENGHEEYWSCSRCKKLFSKADASVVINSPKVIPMLVHEWMEPTYTWNSDNTKCTAKRVDANNILEIETETVSAVTVSTTASTCSVEGEIVKSATFVNSAFEPQTVSIKIAKLNHTYAKHNEKAGDFDHIGENEYDYCTVCGYKNVKEETANNISVGFSGINFVVSSNNSDFVNNVSKIVFINSDSITSISEDNLNVNTLNIRGVVSGTYKLDIYADGYDVVRKEYTIIAPSNGIGTINASQDSSNNLVISSTNSDVINSIYKGKISRVYLNDGIKDIELNNKFKLNNSSLTVSASDLKELSVLNKDYTLNISLFGYTNYSKTITINNIKDAKHNVTLLGNGGKFGNETTKVIQVNDCEKLDSSIIPTRNGYNFSGWQTSDNKAFDLETLIEKDITLTAVWTAIEYEISYDLIGGDVSGNPIKYTIESSNITLNNPSKNGYEFIGWSGSGLTGINNKNVVIEKGSTGNKTYKANYSAIIYSIAYEYNGGSIPNNPNTYTIEDSFSLLDSTKIGYTFDGWYKEDSFVNRINSLNGNYGDLKLYAKFTPNKYNVTFDSDGGSECSQISVTYDETYGNLLPTTTKENYLFVGWFLDEGDTISEITSETVVKITSDVTLKAYWKAPEERTITYILNGGKNASNNPVKYTSLSDDITLCDASKDGYTFDGWYRDKDFIQQIETIDCDEEDEDLVLYAKFIANNYIVTFDANGGLELSQNSKQVTYDEKYGELPVTSKNGYRFNGWYLNNTQVLEDSIVSITEDTTLVANWAAINYSISYDLDGGTVSENNPTIYNIESTEIVLNNPTKEGYTFIGWSGTDLTGNNNKNVAIASGSTGNRSYVANYEANSNTKYEVHHLKQDVDDVNLYNEVIEDKKTLTGITDSIIEPEVNSYTGFSSPNKQSVSIAADGSTCVNYYYTRNSYQLNVIKGNGIDTSTISGFYKYEKQIDLSATLKVGYKDIVWQGDMNTTSFTMPASDVTMQASATPINYSISYDLDGGTVSENNPTIYNIESTEIVLNNPTKEGYTFIGWSGTDLTGNNNKNVAIASGSTGNRSYVANYEANTYKLIFDANDGKVEPSQVDIKYGDTYGTLPMPTRTGYNFRNWYTAKVNGEIVSSNEKFIDTKNKTIYALWDIVNYNIIYELNGGEVITQNHETYNIESDSFVLNNPTKEGYTFIGWSGTDLIGDTNLEVVIPIGSTGDRKYIANFEEKVDYGDIIEEDLPIYKNLQAPINMWTSEIDDVTYTGKAITPDIRVYDDTKLLVQKTDYTIKYSNNIKAGTATITITGKGLYTGTIKKTYEILPIELTKDNVVIKTNKEYFTYSGKVLKPTITSVVYTNDSGKEIKLKSGTDYIANIPTDSINVGDTPYYISIEGKGNYHTEEPFEIEYRIVPKAIGDLKVSGIKDFNYGDEINQDSIVIKDGTKQLENKKDYIVSYDEDNVSLGTHELTITGRNDKGYYGTVTKTFKIKGISLSKAKFNNFISSTVYTGEELTQESLNEALSREFYLTYTANKVTTTLRGISTDEYNGLPNDAKKEYDYTFEYSNNTNIGTATVIYTGVNGYSGTVKKTFKITGIALSKAKFELDGLPYKSIPNQTYTGNAIEIECNSEENKGISLYYQSNSKDPSTRKDLEEGTDYTVTYQKNTDKGTATIVFTGKGLYTGTVKKTFKITALPLIVDGMLNEDITVKPIPDQIYQKGGVKPDVQVEFKGTKLVLNKDYTLSYKNNAAVNDNTNPKKITSVTIKGKGNYSGSITSYFEIEQSDISKLIRTAADKVASSKANQYKTTATIIDSDGKKLTAGKDYILSDYSYVSDGIEIINSKTKELELRNNGDPVESTDIIPAGTKLKVKINGIGNYFNYDDTLVYYNITKNNISSTTVKIADKYYTGGKIELSEDDIIIKSKNGLEQLVYGKDYEIVSYQNNIKVGKASVTIKGIGNYGLTKVVNFKIKARVFVLTDFISRIFG